MRTPYAALLTLLACDPHETVDALSALEVGLPPDWPEALGAPPAWGAAWVGDDQMKIVTIVGAGDDLTAWAAGRLDATWRRLPVTLGDAAWVGPGCQEVLLAGANVHLSHLGHDPAPLGVVPAGWPADVPLERPLCGFSDADSAMVFTEVAPTPPAGWRREGERWTAPDGRVVQVSSSNGYFMAVFATRGEVLDPADAP